MSSLHTILQEGIRFHQQGLFPQAEQRYRRILSVQPDHGWAHHFLGAIAQEYAHHEDAIRHFRQAAHRLPTNAAAWNGMGRSMFALHQYEDARTAHEHAVALDSRQPNFFNNLGMTYFALEEYEHAKKAFLDSVQLEPNVHEAWCNLGRVELIQEEYHAAKQSLERALSIHDQHWESWTNLGMAREGLHDIEQAGHAYQRAVQLVKNQPQPYFNLAQWFHKQGNRSEAQKNYRQVIELDRHHEQAYIQIFDTYVDVDKKIRVLQDGLRSNPQSLSISLTLIQLYQQLESPRKAEELCRTSLVYHSDSSVLQVEYVRALLGQLRLDEAERLLAEIQEPLRMVYSCQIALYRARTDIDGAIAAAQEGLEHHGDSVDLHNALGVLYAEQGAFEQAKASYLKALSIEPNNTAVQRHLSLIQGVRDEERIRLHDLFEDTQADTESRIHAGFALASALDKAKEYSHAHTVLHRVNTLHRETFSYSVFLAGLRMERVRRCDELWVRSPLERHTEGPTPIFIVGLPRSGSTLT